MFEGYRKWEKGGLRQPARLAAAVFEYRADADEYRLVDFVTEHLNLSPEQSTEIDALYEVYLLWHGKLDDETPKLGKRSLVKKLGAFGARQTTPTYLGVSAPRQLAGVGIVDFTYDDSEWIN
jgi:hypothetical protein